MRWPLSQEYNESLQDLALNCSDPELQRGQAMTNALGLPVPCSGNFADVYQIRNGTRSWAVKCFTREIPGLRDRYIEIGAHLQKVRLPFMVAFDYLDQGIRVRGQQYPVLKMDWIEGITLNEFVRQNLHKPKVLEELAQLWVKLASFLREANLAHCDLQHGNVLLVPGSKAGALALKLVDYDGMYVPALAGRPSGEVGHPSYQHPQRIREGTYSSEVDRFPLLVIYCAIRSSMVGGRALWERFDNGDNLLFQEQDLRNPRQSDLFKGLARLNDPEVRRLVECLSRAARRPLDQTPLLEQLFPSGLGAQSITVGKSKGKETTAPAEAVGQVWSTAPPPIRVLGGQTATTRIETPEPIDGQVATQRSDADKTARTYRRLMSKRLSRALASGVRTHRACDHSNLRRCAIRHARSPKEVDADNNGKSRNQEPKERKPPIPIPRDLPVPGLNARNYAVDLGDGVKMRFVRIEAGEFYMGSAEGGFENERPQHRVTIGSAFWISTHKTTQAQFEKILGRKPSSFSATGNFKDKVVGLDTLGFPVESVSWFDAVDFCNKLSERDRLRPCYKFSIGVRAGNASNPDRDTWITSADVKLLSDGAGYRLPNEAEWEYCARAEGGGGKKGATYWFGNDEVRLRDYAWFFDNSGDRMHNVGECPANPLRLYDMGGLVWEWCEDVWHDDYQGAPSNGSSWRDGGDPARRVVRGGAWNGNAWHCRSANRNWALADRPQPVVGFRVVLVSPEQKTMSAD